MGQTKGGWRHFHILDLDDFTREELELVFTTAEGMKEVLNRQVKKVPALRGKRVVTLFYEPSTRTRMSFEIAAKTLSADVVNLAASVSSAAKGESLLDTLRTIQALGADYLILRHPSSGAPYVAAREVEFPVINAGDGWHAHPTQALLDLFTLRLKLGELSGIKVVIVGDILHSRVARSNIWGLSLMEARVVLCGPPTLLPKGLNGRGKEGEAPFSFPAVEIETDLDRALEGAQVIMALRLQRERQEAGLLPSMREYIQRYQLNSQRLSRASPRAVVLHPGPMNEGVEITPEVAQGSQSLILEQVTNGVAVRMALFYLLAGRGNGL